MRRSSLRSHYIIFLYKPVWIECASAALLRFPRQGATTKDAPGQEQDSRGARRMTSEIESRVLRKITLRIVPFIMLLYFVAFIDRVNIGFAALTMNKDLGFSPAVYGFGAGIFFWGYF